MKSSRDDRTRTCDHSIPNAAFYLLNYIPKYSFLTGMSKPYLGNAVFYTALNQLSYLRILLFKLCGGQDSNLRPVAWIAF